MGGRRSGQFRERLAVARDGAIVVVAAGLVLMAVGSALSRIGDVVLVLIISTMLTIFLLPSVRRLSRHMARPLAVVLVMLAAVTLLLGGGGFVVLLLIAQLRGLALHLPADLARLTIMANGVLHWARRFGVVVDLGTLKHRLVASIGSVSSLVISQSLSFLVGLASAVGGTVLVVFVTLYLLLDWERFPPTLLRLVPTAQQPALLEVEATLTRVIRGYLRAQLTMSLAVGVGFGLGAWLIGLPDPLALAVLAALMELIPVLGPILAAVLPLLLALLGPHPYVQGFEVLVLYAIVHIGESQILVPRIMRSHVGLHPIFSVVALMAGALLLGFWGAVFAVPTAGLVVAAWEAGVEAWRQRVVLQSPILRPDTPAAPPDEPSALDGP
jgi:predicted PurR-regulated permease PerM